KGVGDGKQVDIPAPPRDRSSDGETQSDRKCAPLDVCVQAVRKLDRQIRPIIPSCDGEGQRVPKFPNPHCQEKPLARAQAPVPSTATGRRGENPKVSGRSLLKDLATRARQRREKGCFSFARSRSE